MMTKRAADHTPFDLRLSGRTSVELSAFRKQPGPAADEWHIDAASTQQGVVAALTIASTCSLVISDFNILIRSMAFLSPAHIFECNPVVIIRLCATEGKRILRSANKSGIPIANPALRNPPSASPLHKRLHLRAGILHILHHHQDLLENRIIIPQDLLRFSSISLPVDR